MSSPIPPSSNYTAEDIKRINEDIEAVKQDAAQHTADLSHNFRLQYDLQNLSNDPTIPQELKDHIQTLCQNMTDNAGNIDLADVMRVQYDISKLPTPTNE